MSKMKMSIEEYKRCNGNQCPFCYSLEIFEEEFDKAGNLGFQNVTCKNCRKTWQNQWDLVAFVN